MRRTINFKDADSNKVVFEAEITNRNGYPEFTASGEYCGSAGQCFGDVKPATDEQRQLIYLWQRWHLNGMSAGTPEQQARLKECISQKYEDRVQFLKLVGLYEVKHPKTGEPFKYGHSWYTEDLPEDFENTLNSLMDVIEETEGLGAIAVTEEHIELFKDFAEPEAVHALALMLDLNIDDIPDIEENGDGSYTVQGVYYLCGTDDEMNEHAIDYIRESVWAFNSGFLADYCEIDGSVFDALQPQYEGANDAILTLIESKGSIEDFAEEAMQADGRGHFLNHYDGSEDEIELNGVCYYACRE